MSEPTPPGHGEPRNVGAVPGAETETTVRVWMVTVKAYGHVTVDRITAPTRRDAEEIALRRVSFSIESKEVKRHA